MLDIISHSRFTLYVFKYLFSTVIFWVYHRHKDMRTLGFPITLIRLQAKESMNKFITVASEV